MQCPDCDWDISNLTGIQEKCPACDTLLRKDIHTGLYRVPQPLNHPDLEKKPEPLKRGETIKFLPCSEWSSPSLGLDGPLTRIMPVKEFSFMPTSFKSSTPLYRQPGNVRLITVRGRDWQGNRVTSVE